MLVSRHSSSTPLNFLRRSSPLLTSLSSCLTSSAISSRTTSTMNYGAPPQSRLRAHIALVSTDERRSTDPCLSFWQATRAPRKTVGSQSRSLESFANLAAVQGRSGKFIPRIPRLHRHSGLHHSQSSRTRHSLRRRNRGIFIPAYKAISQWNKARYADLDVFGHFHQSKDGGNFICNGAGIGYNSFALSIKADFEHPSQTFFLVDHKRKVKTAVSRIFPS